MRFLQVLILSLIVALMAHPTFASKGRMTTPEDLKLLKQDVVVGKIKVGRSRMKILRDAYGDPEKITENERQVTFDYGDLKIVFDKTQILKKWQYDSFKTPVYTDEVNDLRYDLESGELVGKNITYTRIRKTYKEPTESMETTDDGAMSIYYYGDIKLVFENVYTVRSWQGQKLGVTTTSEGKFE